MALFVQRHLYMTCPFTGFLPILFIYKGRAGEPAAQEANLKPGFNP
jgi:hypothetical protein